MSVNRYYSSIAAETTLAVSASNSTTTLQVASTSGFPSSYPFTLILDEGTVKEEAVEVSSASGTILTVSRGVDGTLAQSHDAGAVVRHGVTARDFREPQEHIAASSGVHGASSSLVGVSDTQTLTNKTIDSAANTLSISRTSIKAEAWTSYTPTISGTGWALGNGTVTGGYARIGNTIHFRGRLAWGTTSTFGTGVLLITAPITAFNNYDHTGMGVSCVIAGNRYPLHGVLSGGTNTMYVFGHWTQAVPGYTRAVGVTNTVPAAWAAGDRIDFFGTYEAA